MDIISLLEENKKLKKKVCYYNNEHKITEIIEDSRFIKIGNNIFDKSVETGYRKKGKKDTHYNLEEICFAIEDPNKQTGEYIKECRKRGISLMSAVDRSGILGLLEGYTKVEIDKILVDPLEMDLSQESIEDDYVKMINASEFYMCDRAHDYSQIFAKLKQKTSNIDLNFSSMSEISNKNNPKDKKEVPLIVILTGRGCQFSMKMVRNLLENGTLNEGDERWNKIIMKNNKKYEITENPDSLSQREWERVACVFIQNTTMWATNWKNRSKCPWIYLGFDQNTKTESYMTKILFSHSERHRDNLQHSKIWNIIDKYEARIQ
eukprot:GHVP01050157.1.p1 GENE.GHVP01050157.1~~GHVP01050157.1.p1  ORF type:complete len:320 (+),score=56.34 GHVP01050157.1:1218-2177(+)